MFRRMPDRMNIDEENESEDEMCKMLTIMADVLISF